MGTYSALNIGTFAAATTSYSATVPNATNHVMLTPTVNESNATVKVGKGTSLTGVTSGSASAAIALSEGASVLMVEVTVEDGTATRTYTVPVTRQAAHSLPAASVSLSASPNLVAEGPAATVAVTLSAVQSSAVTIPLPLRAGLAESGGFSRLSSIVICADIDDETFTVALG